MPIITPTERKMRIIYTKPHNSTQLNTKNKNFVRIDNL